jgi:hypothetical protein
VHPRHALNQTVYDCDVVSAPRPVQLVWKNLPRG